jgi:hypothetical protein
MVRWGMANLASYSLPSRSRVSATGSTPWFHRVPPPYAFQRLPAESPLKSTSYVKYKSDAELKAPARHAHRHVNRTHLICIFPPRSFRKEKHASEGTDRGLSYWSKRKSTRIALEFEGWEMDQWHAQHRVQLQPRQREGRSRNAWWRGAGSTRI